MRWSELLERWGVEASEAGLAPDGAALTADAPAALEPSVPWRDRLAFRLRAPEWRAAYAAGGGPVIVDRRFGRGSVSLLAGCRVVSNETLRASPAPRLLAWLVGPNASVAFEETHLGVEEQPGVAALAHRYRLHGVGLALLLLAALYLWRQLLPFPALAGEHGGADGPVAGLDAASGLVRLLRRNVPRGQVLGACLAEWKRVHPRRVAVETEAAMDRLGREAAASGDAAGGYRAICGLLARAGRRG